jgi:RNA polymerase sigma-70 factor (ECF subfamily)
LLIFQTKAKKVDRKHEQALIKAAKSGDSDAFTELYRANVQPIYRYIFARVQSQPIAEDLTSEVFMRALEGLADYQDRATPLLAWLFRIAHGRVVDYIRHAQYTDSQDIETIEVGVEYDFDGALMADQKVDEVLHAVKTLSDDHRQILMLRFVEDYSLESASALIGKSLSATKALQRRALQALGKALLRRGQAFHDEHEGG